MSLRQGTKRRAGVPGTLSSEEGGRCGATQLLLLVLGGSGGMSRRLEPAAVGVKGQSWRQACTTARRAGGREPLLGFSRLLGFLLEPLMQNLAGNQVAEEKRRVPAPESPSTEQKSGSGAERQELGNWPNNLPKVLLFCLLHSPSVLLELIFVNGRSLASWPPLLTDLVSLN